MRKTFLKVALIGLLAAAMPSTFTSCKDYDTDIEQLNKENADLKTQLQGVTSTIASLQTALNAAQSAADAAKTAAAAAQTAADKAAAEGKAAAAQAEANALKAAQEELKALETELTKQIAANAEGVADNKAAIAENAKTIAEINGRLQTLEALASQLGGMEDVIKSLQDAQDVLTNQLNDVKNSVTELKTSVLENSTKIGNLEAALATQTDALAAYKDSNDQAVNGVKGDIASAQADIANLKEQIDALSEKGYDDTEIKAAIATITEKVAELSTKINDINEDINTLKAGIGVIKSMVTHVEFVKNQPELQLGFATPAVVDYTFGKGEFPTTKFNQTIANPITFEQGKQQTFDASLLIRVSPTNAVITADQISLVNSQLGNLSEFIEIAGVEKYTELLTRGVENNGLWEVSFQLKDGYDKDAFAQLTQKSSVNKNILYALAIDNKATGNESVDAEFVNRSVTTAYDLTIVGTAKNPVTKLDYTVNGTSVAEIHNRYLYADEPNSNSKNPSLVYAENVVENGATNMPAVYANTQVVDYETSGYLVVGDYAWGKVNDRKTACVANSENGTYNDDRTTVDKAQVSIGKPFEVELANSDVYAFYVALDLQRAIVSNGSEFNAWEGYVGKIDGLNTITTEGSIKLTITEAANVAQGEVIGFRVWAVNYDGTLVDPDGRAFYVQVGQAPVESASGITANIMAPDLKLPETNGSTSINLLSALGSWTNQPSVNVKFTLANNNPTNNDNVTIKLGSEEVKANGEAVTLPRNAGTGNNANYNAYFRSVNVVLGDYDFVDGQAYKGTLNITDANGLVLQTIPVSVTKSIPGVGVLPASIAPIAGQITNNSGTAYITSNSFDFKTMFNGLDNSDVSLNIKSGNTVLAPATDGVVDLTDDIMKNVNSGTKYNVVIGYNYGLISKPKKDSSLTPITRTATYSIDFATQANTIKFDWTTAPKLVYGEELSVSTDNITLTSIFTMFNGNLTTAIVDEKIEGVEISIDGDVAKYFTVNFTAPTKKTTSSTAKTDGMITFEPISGANPTTSVVTGRIKISYKDAGSTLAVCTKNLNIQMN